MIASGFFAKLARMMDEPEEQTRAEEQMTNWVERAEFYQEHLNRVSRSFAFCIERLETPLRAHVGLAYLICRILDTVEDAAWENSVLQDRAFQSFQEFIQNPSTVEAVAEWRKGIPGGLPPGEETLLDQAWEIFRDFHVLSPELQDILRDPILSMASGMRFFQLRAVGGELRLRDLSEVNQYCFFVAGVVGEILTRLLVLEAKGERGAQAPDLEKSIHFGLFLQKVNLLKDQLQDEPEGRFLVPSREAVRQSLRDDANGAIAYLLAIPERFEGYRLFCAWSLLLGLASLPWIERSWRERALIKIPREQTLILLAEIESMINDNDALTEKFKTLLAEGMDVEAPGVMAETTNEASGESADASQSESPNETSIGRIQALLELYQGALSRSQVARLMLA